MVSKPLKIVLIGKFGAGKDSVADILCFNYRFKRYAFADKLKEIALDMFPTQCMDWDRNTDEGKPRRLLQDLGLKLREIDEDCWVNHVLWKIKRSPWTTYGKVITDCRFPNEYELCKQAGFIAVKVDCPDELRFDRLEKRDGRRPTAEEQAHISEQLEVACDYVIYNGGTLEELASDVDRMIRYFEGRMNV